MKISFCETYILPLDEKHRFPMRKYELIPEQLKYEGIITDKDIIKPQPCALSIIGETHQMDFIQRAMNVELSKKEVRNLGFPQSPELFHRELVITQGSIDLALYALENKSVGINVAGGTHHAFYDKGEGFCLFNDFAVTAKYLLNRNLVSRILIIDLDVHQGNGTASLFKEDPRVFTFSMHGARNYPFHKEFSDLDIELEDGIEDEKYLSILNSHLDQLLNTHKPDIVFFLAGVDILHTDKLGKLGVSTMGCAERDRIVVQACFDRGLPILIAMGGGYSPKINDIVKAHCNTFKIAQEIYALG